MTREKAIKVLEMFLHKQCDLGRTEFAYDQLTIWDAVKMASDALEQEPRKGKWHRQTNDYVDYYECSECGMAMGIYDVKNYCPNCGSRNEVEE